jgi:hypothetical protein
MSILLQITYGNMALIVLSYLHDSMDKSVRIFYKKENCFFLTFLPYILMTTSQRTAKLFREFWGTCILLFQLLQ